VAGDAATVKALLDATPSLIAQLTDDDERRLPFTAQRENLAAVRLMLTAGWPVDARGQHGGTALHWAAWHGHLEMVREILRFHPVVDLRSIDYDGTAVQWAEHAAEHGWHPGVGDYADVIALLKAADRHA